MRQEEFEKVKASIERALQAKGLLKGDRCLILCHGHGEGVEGI